ncbi:hypothetical protein K7402_27370 [Pseudomonas fluorescens group sp.]|uniref:Uncharacterized protein n=2 Tax=Pseudomonas fluorescens TaxID=294 RepID=C3K642_PSEFS|nr:MULTISPECIES: hypothetical protein [Pseudomonas]MBZ6458829.1 hypothetical protein [Pseudomonas fluorescens group sp.]MBZ6465137.1 hypothetical protein [Pseudomonas fluorescens group sp.]MBZ6471120.1 hypothetical protein [Pseudomonas fluorescens group sp.]PLR63051.1 hypothetical protein QCBJ_11835 [Pseudomonas sp. QC2]WQD73986.1 hypothetical protein U0037_08475 [Pseudomonas marginalis]
MMLLRTLVLERNGQDAPVNGALLCGFAVGQAASNFLVYSLDEEVEPGSSRVYIAALRKKLDRYFLSGVESKEDLQVALHVFKQILTLAASGIKAGGVTETQVPYHFLDLKGCKLPPARPEDHHSVIIKKALVMKVITLGMSAPTLPAIESASVIVPSIRFSSQMTSPPKGAGASEPSRPPVHEQPVEEPRQARVEAPVIMTPAVPAIPHEPDAPTQSNLPASGEHSTLFEVDSTLTNLARVAQELTQQKRAALERESALEQWQARLQQEQSQLDQKVRELEQRTTQLHDHSLAVSQRAEALKAMTSQVSGLRQSLRGMLLELDQALDG